MCAIFLQLITSFLFWKQLISGLRLRLATGTSLPALNCFQGCRSAIKCSRRSLTQSIQRLEEQPSHLFALPTMAAMSFLCSRWPVTSICLTRCISCTGHSSCCMRLFTLARVHAPVPQTTPSRCITCGMALTYLRCYNTLLELLVRGDFGSPFPTLVST